MEKTTLTKIVITEDDWVNLNTTILSSDLPDTDFLLVQIGPLDPYGWDYRNIVYSVSKLRENERTPLYDGESFTKAIGTIF